MKISLYPKLLLLPLAAALLPTPTRALEIVIDYTYDTNNFFDTDEKRAAIEAVADFYGAMITDTLLRIDPAEFSSASWTPRFTHPTSGVSTALPSLQIIPENTIIVYVGARELGGSTAGSAGPGGFSATGFSDWFAHLRGRGSSEADSGNFAENTDFALWGGSIAFDTPRDWNFSQSSNAAGTEFIAIALHEMGHVLGIGSADSWTNLIDSDNLFLGPNVIRSNGNASPLADSSHFRGMPGMLDTLDSELFGSFSASHGTSRPVLMLPGSTDTGSNFDVITDLDLAALVDIGWELEPDLNFQASSLSPSSVDLQWNTVSFKQYAVKRSTDLPAFIDVRLPEDGDGTTDTYSDPSPPSDKAFYQIASSDIGGAAPAAMNLAPLNSRTEQITVTGGGGVYSASQEPVVISCPAH